MKIIPNTNDCYSATEDGKIFSHNGGKTVEKIQFTNGAGYKSVGIYDKGKQRRFYVHQLVMRTFVGDKPFLKANINHIDGDKNNNSISNLEYCTYKENHAHAIQNGLRNPVGEGNGRAKLTKEKVIVMRHLYDIGNPSNTIARLFGIGYTQSTRVCKRVQWKHVN